MMILSPANSIEEAKAVFEAGSDGIYIGGVTTIYSNYPQNGEAWRIGENQISEEEFRRLVDYCKEQKKYVQFEVYTDGFSNAVSSDAPDLIRYFDKYVETAVQAGVDSLLFDDIGAILRAREICQGIKINASFLLDSINTAQVEFFHQLNVDTVELSPQLSSSEIREIAKHSSAQLALISHLGCAAYEGACYIDHFLSDGENLIPIGLPCKAEYTVHCNEEKVVQCKMFEQTQSCSICALPELFQLNLNYLKTPGRHIEPELILEWTKVYRYAFDLINQNTGITASELKTSITKAFPRWRLWCRLNRSKKCLYEEKD